jgi:hypothetical protein
MCFPPIYINLHIKDIALLTRIQSFFGVGSISISKSAAKYQVQSLKDITNVIIPHFNKYPLLTQKIRDFMIFKSIVELMSKKDHLTEEGLIKIISILASNNKSLNEEVTKSFTGKLLSLPIENPLAVEPKGINPNQNRVFSIIKI